MVIAVNTIIFVIIIIVVSSHLSDMMSVLTASRECSDLPAETVFVNDSWIAFSYFSL